MRNKLRWGLDVVLLWVVGIFWFFTSMAATSLTLWTKKNAIIPSTTIIITVIVLHASFYLFLPQHNKSFFSLVLKLNTSSWYSTFICSQTLSVGVNAFFLLLLLNSRTNGHPIPPHTLTLNIVNIIRSWKLFTVGHASCK